MPRIEYQRTDLPLRVFLETPDRVVLRLGEPSSDRRAVLELEELKRSGTITQDLSWLFRDLPSSCWVKSAEHLAMQSLCRIVLDIRDLGVAEFDWETLLLTATHEIEWPGGTWPMPPLIVRQCLVRPRSATLPLTLPLRILQLLPRPEHAIPSWVRDLFGNRPPEEVAQAVMAVASLTWGPPAEWPTVEVLHLDSLPLLGLRSMTLKTAFPNLPGTLGWLARWTERWQTRLVVINCDTAGDAASARRLAHALCNRGGPAIVVVYTQGTVTPPAQNFYHQFYNYLVHDHAIDDLLVDLRQPHVTAALFAGSGREDALRVSNVGLELSELSRMLKDEAMFPETSLDYRELFSEPGTAARARHVLQDVETKWDSFQFDTHEGGGLIPLSHYLNQIREIRRQSEVFPQVSHAPPAPASSPLPRFVNSSLWREVTGEYAIIEQDSAGLTAGEVYQLAVQIGAKDVRIQTIGATALIEEVFKWSPEVQGAWVEIAVVGIDFEVIGDPVQELWLPREGETEPVYFAISSPKAGIAQLRFGLYFENNLIQSFRLAAKVLIQGETAGPRSDEMAQALSVPVTRIGNACYMARMEYSRTSDFSEIERKGGRALTLVANKLDNRDILTIKGSDVWHTEVKPDNDIPNIVTQIRNALDEIAFDKIVGGPSQYRFFGQPADIESRCRKAISKLASTGWNLFTNLAPSADLQNEICELLDGEGKTIHVAQLLREKVIPWAFVYDRCYDEHLHKLSGVAVEHGTCLAALPEQGCPFQYLKCGEPAECLLNQNRQAERKAQGLPLYHERTVACPMHFWGFRHVLEVPPQQVNEESDESRSESAAITPSGPLQLAAGLNAKLPLCSDHWKELLTLSGWIDPQYDRDEILDLLRTKEPDFIYFYCHARGGQVDVEKTYPPYLEFQKPDPALPGIVRPQDFSGDPAWSHSPLVFLNACGTLGYSPDALSPFLKSLVDGRKASGVLGTEVPVAEALAGDFAREFISRFIGGAKAGEAVLGARRTLLARKNPLGLVYTLFAPADLKIKP